MLRTAGLIASSRDASTVVLADGVQSDAVVRFLVEHNFAVYEVAPAEETLEGFYISLMENQRNSPPVQLPPPVPLP